jgi:hypothetical protein
MDPSDQFCAINPAYRRASCQCACGCKLPIIYRKDSTPKAFCWHCTGPEKHRAKYIALGMKNEQ